MADTPTKPKAKRKPRHAKGDGGTLPPQRFKFAMAYAAGMSQKDAALAAGYSPNSTAAPYDAMKDPRVKAEVERVRESLRQQTEYDAQRAFEEAGAAVAFAEKTNNATAYCRAIELRMRLNGLLVDKQKIEFESTIDIAGALAEARARATLRPTCDPALIEDAEYTTQSSGCSVGARDYESVSRLPAPPSPRSPDMDS